MGWERPEAREEGEGKVFVSRLRKHKLIANAPGTPASGVAIQQTGITLLMN